MRCATAAKICAFSLDSACTFRSGGDSSRLVNRTRVPKRETSRAVRLETSMTLSFACSKNASLAFTELGTPCSRPSVDSSRARLNLRKIVPATTATYSGKSPQTLVTALGGKCSTYPAACATFAVLCSTYAARAFTPTAAVNANISAPSKNASRIAASSSSIARSARLFARSLALRRPLARSRSEYPSPPGSSSRPRPRPRPSLASLSLASVAPSSRVRVDRSRARSTVPSRRRIARATWTRDSPTRSPRAP